MPARISRAFKDFSASLGKFRAGLVMLLAVVLLGTEAVPTFAQSPQTPDPSTIESQVKKFGVGKSVKVTLVGGQLIRGHIRNIGPDSFTVKIGKKSTVRSIPYAQVTEVKDPGPLVWMLIGVAVAVIIVVIIRH